MTANNNALKPKIMIYGTGQFGQYITRMADAKGWPIVAAVNRAGDKVGQDMGRLAGLDKDLGVIVQDCDQFDYDAVDADVAIVAITNRLSLDMPAFKKLLSAGINVISHAAEAYLPFSIDAELAGEIDALAKANNATFTGTGIWDMSRIWTGIMVAGPCTEINALHHKSITDASRIGKPGFLQCGVGLTEEQFFEAMKNASAAGGLYPTIPEHVMISLGYNVTKTSEKIEPVVFDEPVYSELLEKEIDAGLVVGTRIIAEVETVEGVTAEAHIELRMFKPDEVEYMYWKIDGKPSSSIRVERDDSAYATAACMFNRIQYVIPAEPGIKLVSELGPIKHTALS